MFRNSESEDAIGGEAGTPSSSCLDGDFNLPTHIDHAQRLFLWPIAATGVILQLLTLVGIA